MTTAVRSRWACPAKPQVQRSSECNTSATRLSRVLTATLMIFALAHPVRAQDTPSPEPQPHRTADVVKFLAGAALGLAAHESGHLVLDFAFDAKPRIKRVELGGIPFFAITHRSDLSPRREYAISSAGFWVQESWNEILLTRRPLLRHSHAPLAQGAMAFNILTSIGYAAVAFAKTGPVERDTRGIADAVRVDERVIAAIVLAPALLDGYRYFRPDAAWARWASRAAKIGSGVLVLKRND